MSAEIVIIGAGHNGLVCAAYLARAGLDVLVLEAGQQPGGCLVTEETASGRVERGAYEHAGLRNTGIADELELEVYGLRWILRDELALGLAPDGTTMAFHTSLDRTRDELAAQLGTGEAAAYVDYARWASDAMRILTAADGGPPPSLRAFGAAASAFPGTAASIVRLALAPATALLAERFADSRLRGVLAFPAIWLQQPPAAAGTGAAALKIGSGHGKQAARASGGGQAIAEALTAAVLAAGGRLLCDRSVTRVELAGGRAVAVHAAEERFVASRAVVSAIGAQHLLTDLIGLDQLPDAVADAARGMHTGGHNVGKLKVDAVVASPVAWPGPAGFERAAILSPGIDKDLDTAFRAVGAGLLPPNLPFELSRPSTLEPGWTGTVDTTITLSSFVPERRADGREWDLATLDKVADRLWAEAETRVGQPLTVRDRRVTGPPEWARRIGGATSDANHLDMTLDQLLAWRPAVSLAAYATPIDGLWLTGASTHPGGGISGNPGRNTALALLASLGLLSRRERLRQGRRRLAALKDAAASARRLKC